MAQHLDDAIAPIIGFAVLRRDVDALLESLETGSEFGSVIVLKLIESGCKGTNIKVTFNRNFLEFRLAR